MALQLCRICGNKEGLLDIMSQGPAMLEKLSKCANIDIKSDDFLPKLICQQCDRMLDMSFQLRRQSETMQEKLHQEIKKQEVTEVHYISDDEITKSEFDLKQENTTNALVGQHHDEEEVTQTSNISNAEEFTAIEQDNLDAKSESTVLASETEDVNEINEVLQSAAQAAVTNSRSFRPVSAEDIETNDSYECAMSKRFAPTIAPDRIVTEDNEVDDEMVDIGDKDDEFMHNTITNSQYGSPLEFCSIDLVSNPGSPTHDIDHEEFELDSRSSLLPYTCVTCNETFLRKKDYAAHIQQHGTSRYQCIQCSLSFPTRYRLSRHEATHMDATTTIHNCGYCKGQYSNSFNLERHIRACHGNDNEQNKYHCDICQVSYARQDVLKRHVLQIHTNKKWHCKACGESFRSAYLLNLHKSNSDCENPPTSSDAAKRKGSLTFPLPPEYIVKVLDNRYKCVHCNALFKTIFTYKNHLLIHQDVRPFPCKICPKSFRTRYAMVNHERIHSNERPFKCEFCPKSFRQVTHLKHHRYQHMKGKMPFTCTTCQIGFVTKWKLRDHLRKHCAEKAFKCAECPEEFFLKYDLKRHARVVHHRSVVIADSDNEGNQKNQFTTEGTTETDRTDDERNVKNEMDDNNDVIDIIDDDDDDDDEQQMHSESSNSMTENVLVLNEADPPSPGDLTEYNKVTDSNLSEAVIDFKNGGELAHPSLPTNVVIHSEDANEPQVHFINFDEDEATTELASDGINKTNANEKKKETIVEYIDLDEGPSNLLLQPSNKDESASVANETAMDIIQLDEDDEEELEGDLTQLPRQSINVMATNEPAMDFRHYDDEDDSKPQIVSSMISKTANQETYDESNAPGMSSEKVIDYIHLDSSNSCKSPPRHFHNEYFDNIIGVEEEQEVYDTITEEKIQITEEKIETFTSFYQLKDLTRS